MDMEMQHVHGHGQGHTAWTWTRSMWLDMQYGLGHAACPFPCFIEMDKYMLYVQVQVYAAMSMSMLQLLVYAPCFSACCMSISVLHIHVTHPGLGHLQQGRGHAAGTGHVAWTYVGM